MANPIATITNNSNVDVDVYDVYNPSGQDDAPLTYTKLGSVARGETKQLQTIHFASQLMAMYDGPVAAMAGNYYYQFPVAVMPIVPLGSDKHTSHTITADEQAGMEQSFLFQRYAVANPDSNIAKDFTIALADPEQDTAVARFFAATKNFQKCTLASWTAVVTWSSQFTSAWQGSYYLYDVPAKGTSDPPKLVATLAITSTAKANTATLTMAGSSASTGVTMNGSGLQEADVGEGGISVSLKPGWMNVVQTGTKDGKITTRYLIGGGMTGVVNGVTVFGNGDQRDLTNTGGLSPAEKERRQQQKQQDFDRTFNHITTIISLAVGMLTAYFFYKQLKNGHAQKSDAAADEAARKPGADDKSVDEAREKVDASYQQELKDVPQDHPEIVEAEQTAAKDMGGAVKAEAQQKAVDALENKVDAQVDALTEVLEEKPPTDLLENTAEQLSDAQDDLADGRIDDAQAKLEEVTKSIDKAASEGTWKEYEEKALNETKEEIQEGKEQADAVEKANEERDADASEPADNTDLDTSDLGETPEFGEGGE